MSSRVYAITRLDAEEAAAELSRILRYRGWEIHSGEGRSLVGTSTGWNTRPGRTLDGRAILDARVTLDADDRGIGARVQYRPRWTLYLMGGLLGAGVVGTAMSGPPQGGAVVGVVGVVVLGIAFAYHRSSLGSDIDHSLRAIAEDERSDATIADVFD